jgi:uncharacterized 2Fe-2S/4Fe-4S cluster protein (DUF4445 family)
MIRITTHDGQTHELATAESLTLAQAIFLSGLWEGVPLCAGMGKCGLCRVQFTSSPPAPTAEELRRLGEEAIGTGWRLSCLHPASACDISLPEPKRSARQRSQRHETFPAGSALTLAIDLGTTSIHWAALSGDQLLASGQGLNPQMGLGSEVMARLAFAARPGGQDILSELVRQRLEDLIRQVESEHGGTVERLCVAGNSAMTYIFLKLPTAGLARAPYLLDYAGGDAQEVVGLPPVLMPPLLAPFVGADLSAGMAALQFSQDGPPAYPYLLADLGTNGEFVLALSPERFLLASVPMGPALEGVGLRHGRIAAPGSVRGYCLSPTGLKPDYVDRAPLTGEDSGITGVGYLSLAAALLRAGVLDESGRFVVPATPLGKRVAQGVTLVHGEPTLSLPGELTLPASDLEELIKVKAAFNLALSRLLAEAELPPTALSAVYLAGAMGEHVDAADLTTLGILPEVLTTKVHRVGNTSLAGARLLLTSPAAWDWTCALPQFCRTLDLASDPRFGALYIERMVLRHVA